MDKKKVGIRHISGLDQLSENDFIKAMLTHAAEEKVACVNWPEYPYSPDITLHIAYSDTALCLLYKVKEEHVLGTVLENNGPVWEDSCVETFIKDPVGDGYYNIEVTCIATKLAAHRISRTDFELFDAEAISKIRCFSTLPHTQTDLSNEEWMVGKIIPFASLGLEKAPESLKVNFYKCGDKCRQPHFLSWSPIGLLTPNFHCPEFFGEINL